MKLDLIAESIIKNIFQYAVIENVKKICVKLVNIIIIINYLIETYIILNQLLININL